MAEYYVELNKVLNEVRRRWRAVVGLRACAQASVVAALLIGLALLANAIVTPLGAGLVGLAAVTAFGVVSCLLWLAWTLRDAPDRQRLARFIEEHCPELEDRLVTAVALGDKGPPATSSLLVEPLVADATDRMRTIDLDRIVSRAAVHRGAWSASVAVAILLAALFVSRTPAGRALEAVTVYAFPSRFAIEVIPGDAKIRAGQPLRIRARLSAGGVVTPTLHISGDRQRDMTMNQDDRHEFSVGFDAVSESFTYRISAGKTSSRDYAVRVVRPPRVARIDLHYDYPPSLGLAPRTEEDSGDIYAPSGTRVGIRVKADQPIEHGAMKLTDGTTVPLKPVSPDLLAAELKIAEDGSYRVTLADSDGLDNPGDTEYFIRTLDDRPPDVRIVRPASDRQVTRLEEVTVEARADDDFGIDRFELVYSVRGGPEKAVPLSRARRALTVKGTHTLYLEELDVQPGDFVTYYARARDVSRGRRSTDARSDMFFIEVKPYDEEFVAAQSQAAMGSGGDRSLDDLGVAQKEIIIATWKLDRRSVSGRSQADIQSVARAQGELRGRAAKAASQFRQSMQEPRWRRPRSGQGAPEEPRTSGADPMVLAVDAMGLAQGSLEGLKTASALPHEMEALNQLLKAQADVRRRQVARQQASGANGAGSNRPTQDLSSLFDRELQRLQQTNYETPSSSESRNEPAQSETLDKVRDLAKRQDELNRQQQDLAKQRAHMSPEELKRRLERLTREQSELRRQAEELSRKLAGEQPPSAQSVQSAQSDGKGQSSGSAGANRMRDITEDMRSAASELRRQDPVQASARSGRALEKLRDLERRLQNSRPDDRRRAVGDLQLEARQLADAQRQIASEVQRMGKAQAARDGFRRLAGEKDRLADRVERLGESVKHLEASAGKDTDERRAIGAVGEELDRQQIDRRMRESAEAFRRQAGDDGQASAGGKNEGESKGAAAKPTDAGPTGEAGRERLTSAEQDLTRALDRVAEKMGAAGGERDLASRKLSDQLARTRELRDRLNEVARKIDETARRMSQETAPTPGGKDSGSAAKSGKEGETGAQGSGGDGGGGKLARLQEEYARQLRQVQELASELRRDNQEGAGGRTPEHWERSVSAPGTESFKQDFSSWDVLHREVALALERVEQSLSDRLLEKDTRDRVNAGASDQAPEEYRALVEQYFQSLASKKKH